MISVSNIETSIVKKLRKHFPDDEVSIIVSNIREVEILFEIKRGHYTGYIIIHYKYAKRLYGTWRTKLHKELSSKPNSFGIIVFDQKIPYETIAYNDVLICKTKELVCTIGVIKKLFAINSRILLR